MNRALLLLGAVVLIAGCGDNSNASSAVSSAPTSVSSSSISPSPAAASPSPTATPQKKKLTEQEVAIMSTNVKEAFMKEHSNTKEQVAEPIVLDFNHDGAEEIIVANAKDFQAKALDFYVGFYDAATGKQLMSKKLLTAEETDYQAVTLRTISNETYGKGFALVRAYRGYNARLFAWKANDLQQIDEVSANNGGDGEMIVDLDNDGHEEFVGTENDDGPGSDRIPRSNAVVNQIAFKWDKAQGMYIKSIVGEDGVSDSNRNAIGELTEDKARSILNAAFKVQLSWDNPLKTEEDVRKLLRPFFSNNFIYEFFHGEMSRGVGVVGDKTGMLPKYSMSDDFRWLIPEYSDKPISMLFSADKITAAVSQDIERSAEGQSYTVKASTTLVKTKYGWKIDGFKMTNK